MVFRVSKSLISFVLLHRMKQNINYQTTSARMAFRRLILVYLAFFCCLEFLFLLVFFVCERFVL